MFEKEAEEEINKEHWTYSIFKDLAQEYWQKGAEFGYNKANEWHDLRKNPNDLPKDYKKVLIITLDYGINTCYVAHRLNGIWWSNCKTETFVRVIAWKEIVLPKEIKENE